MNFVSDTNLRTTIKNALLNGWDPIGIQSFPEAVDEYDGYVDDVCALIQSGAKSDQLFAYLWTLETQHMGLSGDRNNTERFAFFLESLAAADSR